MTSVKSGFTRVLPIALVAALAAAPAAAASNVNATASARKAIAAALGTSTPIPAQTPVKAGYTRTRFSIPITINPGQNINKLTWSVPKPPGNFYLVRMQPNLVLADSDSNPNNDRVPRTDIIHLHHMVWIDGSNRGPNGFKLPFGAGEEKTVVTLPDGYGYPVYSDQSWIINDMIHNLTPATIKAKIIYDLDWTPMESTLGQSLKAAYPLWLDVQRGSGYPVFNTFKGTGSNGTITFPDQFSSPYSGLNTPNIWTADRNLTLIGTAGHVHPGGLYTDLQMIRAGANGSASPQPGTQANATRLFRSNAVYYDPAGPISWDMSMEGTPANWKIQVKTGDKLKITATYDTNKGSWYESMGIMVVWAQLDGTDGVDPFTTATNWDKGVVTHGAYLENKYYGGKITTLNDPARLANGPTPTDNTIKIKDFIYQRGDLSLNKRSISARPPVIKQGQQLTFLNLDAPGLSAPDKDQYKSIYHSITDCKSPCNKETGMSYPLANGSMIFDSGQLGFSPSIGRTGIVGSAAAERLTWKTPADLTPGSYTYFCRVHPFMRGAFRVVK